MLALSRASSLVFPAPLPSPLLGAASLLSLLLLAPAVLPLVAPGAALLTAWMALFFSPALISLPLVAPPPPSALARMLAVAVLGWASSLLLASRLASVGPAAAPPAPSAPAPAPSPLLPPRAAAVLYASPFLLLPFAASLPLPFFLASNAAAFVLCNARRIPLHPLLGTALLSQAAVFAHSLLAGCAPRASLALYASTAGAQVSSLLAPSVLALAVSVHNRRALIASSWLPTLLSVVATSLHGLFGTALACRLLRLPPRFSLPLLSRQITSPLALSAAASLGADGSLAIAAVVLTGLLGSVFSRALVGKEVAPLARGLAVGISSHGLGAAALSREDPEAFPGAAVGMALTGAVTAGLASVPAVRRALRVAVGAAAVAA
jgi:putative effector of murein hydrolase